MIGDLVADCIDPTAVAQITSEVLDHGYETPALVADALGAVPLQRSGAGRSPPRMTGGYGTPKALREAIDARFAGRPGTHLRGQRCKAACKTATSFERIWPISFKASDDFERGL